MSYRNFLQKKLLFFMFSMSIAALSYSQLSITGQQVVCTNESEVYQLNNAVPGIQYSWSLTSNLGTINLYPSHQAIIQWVAAGSCSITVTDGNITVTRLVTVNQTYEPTITFNNQVGC